MEIKIKSFKIRIEFSFILVVCAALALDLNAVADVLIYSLLHELGHIAAIYILGESAESLTLSCCGASLKYKNNISTVKEAIIAAAGPAVNLVLFCFLKDKINLLLFILNVLPIFPLDGGRIVKCVFPKSHHIVGIIFLALLTVLSLYFLFKYKTFNLLIITIYLWTVNLRLL